MVNLPLPCARVLLRQLVQLKTEEMNRHYCRLLIALEHTAESTTQRLQYLYYRPFIYDLVVELYSCSDLT